MYHICPPQCQIQLDRGEAFHFRRGFVAETPPQRLSDLALSVLSTIGSVQDRNRLAGGDCRLNLLGFDN